MKKEKTNVSRRNFLSKGAGVAAGATIVAIAGTAPLSAKENANAENAMLANVAVYTEDTQTLTNKTMNSYFNTLGTTALNVKEFSPSGSDITTALNSAISFLTNFAYGGTILIPQGNWTTNGGHDLVSGIVIEGVGYKTNILGGSEIKLNGGASNFVFRVKAPWQNCSLRRLTIDMQNNSNAAGLLLTNHVNGTIVGTNIYATNVEEVNFKYGKYGIHVDSKETNNVSTDFECILNRFERVGFYFCKTGFSCNSINGGYSFDNCYFSVPTTNQPTTDYGRAVYCKWVGNISFKHCLFVGNQTPEANVPPTDGSTILETYGAYNNISFYDCQDENVQYYYRNSGTTQEAGNAWDVPLVFRNCIIQSTFRYTSSGSVIFDACSINVTDIGSGHVKVTDTAYAAAKVYFKGLTKIAWHFNPPLNTKLDDFVNPYSQLVYEHNHVGQPVIHPTPIFTQAYQFNATRGAVQIPQGAAYVSIYNNLVTANSLVFAQLRTYDPGGARIREVQVSGGYMQINLTQAAGAILSVGFVIED